MNDILARSWDAAAELYTKELAPRFMPWILEGVIRMRSFITLLPAEGMILVPCCGPGLELPLLWEELGARYDVLGIDLSEGMVEEASRVIYQHTQNRHNLRVQKGEGVWSVDQTEAEYLRVPRLLRGGEDEQSALKAGLENTKECSPCKIQNPSQVQGDMAAGRNMKAIIGDATSLHNLYSGSAAVVFSSFGLQQLGAKAPQALKSWLECLASGGVAVVLMWPSQCETLGPWKAYDEAVKKLKEKQQNIQQATRTSSSPNCRSVSLPVSQSEAGKGLGSTSGMIDRVDYTQEEKSADMKAEERGVLDSPLQLEEWERGLTSAACELKDVVLMEDCLIQHRMTWPSVDTFWKVMTYGGPWHARKLLFGDSYMSELEIMFKTELQRHLQFINQDRVHSSGVESLSWEDSHVLEHTPCARLLIFQKKSCCQEELNNSRAVGEVAHLRNKL
ncbi:hypothetical protein CEUSTIGMA_g2095.t1 [Chlamydomonas eustigma]|uniref:Methyltransferase domain-containing protein n=1 Tax=Chlamydomonas eustigma TaxID=1157962 RepID=A0A250WUY8_9CHLO|nr:hypothetical protein CEUSTIGMA_g2095.t1 [Chlamydomonas eustigma]|eukprot:GAX74647.1 hypothetical protein CEUSTIGMA_g2095.t1 [Chlamydomonas eustigma]